MNARIIDVFDVGAVPVSEFARSAQAHANKPYDFTRSGQVGDGLSALSHSSGLPADATMQQARGLLARVIARLPRRIPYAVQFLSFEGCGDVASAFCGAAAEQLGAVLQGEPILPDNETQVFDDRICPDLVFPSLAHAKLVIRPTELIALGRSALLRDGDPEFCSYNMIVVDFPCRHNCHELAQTASAFGGTVLVAKAGVTTGQQVRAASRAVQRAGGLVLGLALAQVPARPSWLHCLGAA